MSIVEFRLPNARSTIGRRGLEGASLSRFVRIIPVQAKRAEGPLNRGRVTQGADS